MATTALLVIMARPAFAATAADAVTDSVAPKVEEVIVTARKRSENIQDVPASISVVSHAEIERRDLNGVEAISTATPQFVVGRSPAGSGAQFVLRGVGSAALSSGIEQDVAMVVDGAYYGQGRIINDAFYDISSIQVLKGPQALFFGKNATAGVIAISTEDPTKTFSLMETAGYEFTAEQIKDDFVLSGPVTDTLGFRLAVTASKMYGGYFQNQATPETASTLDVATGMTTLHTALPANRNDPEGSQLAGRLTLKWDPTDRLSVTLKANADNSPDDNPSWNDVIIKCVGPSETLNSSTPCGRTRNIYQNNLPTDIAANFPGARPDGSLYEKYNSGALTANINYSLDHATLTLVANYQENQSLRFSDTDYISSAVARDNIWTLAGAKYWAYSFEGRVLTKNIGPVNILAAVLYDRSSLGITVDNYLDGFSNSNAPTGLEYVAIARSALTEGETISPYFEATWKITDALELSGGARYTSETKNTLFLQPYINPVLAGLYLNGADIVADQKFSNTSPEATLTWKISPDFTTYVAYKTGYKSGGYSGTSIYGKNDTPNLHEFTPETASGFEAGLKGKALDNTLHFELGLYTYEYKNLQIEFQTPEPALISLNAGKARSYGVELEGDYAPPVIEGLRLSGSLSYNNAHYVSFLAPCYTGQTPAEGCTLVGFQGTPFQNLAGHGLLDAPHWTATLGPAYEHSLTNKLIFDGSVDLRYSDSYSASQIADPFAAQSAYGTIDATLSVHTADNHWNLALIGKNLTNTFWITGSNVAPNTGGHTGTPAGVEADEIGWGSLPRTIELRLTYRM